MNDNAHRLKAQLTDISTTPVVTHETHAAWVFLTTETAGNFAYKLKKPISFPYLDYGTVDKRRTFCQREIELNSRTAPALYLSAQALVKTGDTISLVDGDALGDNADPLDWIVKMQRFADTDLLSTYVKENDLSPDLVKQLTANILALHNQAAVQKQEDGLTPITATIEGNDFMFGQQAESLDRSTTQALTQAQLDAAKTLAPILNKRAAAGMIRQCHGDMHLGNICLWDGAPVLFDCIEFNDDFAVIDTLYDLAFLLMDLHFRGLSPIAAQVVDNYDGLGEQDNAALLPLFISIRAAIRAHVSVAMGDVPLAKQYLAMAVDALTPTKTAIAS